MMDTIYYASVKQLTWLSAENILIHNEKTKADVKIVTRKMCEKSETE